MPPKSVYLHIPFCTNKCYYCDFNSFVTSNPQIIWDYLEALQKEMERTFEQTPPDSIDTIFVGGGTPTYLNLEQMRFFLETVHKHLGKHLSDQLEFSMEANPGTTDIEKLKLMRSFGVNRLSFGVQSFDDELLKRIGRIHDAANVYQSVENAVQAGFSNISIDLIFGLPDQTVEQFQTTIDKAMQLPLSHISSYGLKVEENTVFHTLYQKGKLPLPTEEAELEMYLLLIDSLQKYGFHQYEISNFAKVGKESRHNSTYWLNNDYYGLGAGAHGYCNGVRHVNAGPLAKYVEMAQQCLPRVDEFTVPSNEAMEDQLILGLRFIQGVELRRFEQRFGCSVEDEFGPIVREEIDKGMLEIKDGFLRLTKKGLPLGNEVFARFLREE